MKTAAKIDLEDESGKKTIKVKSEQSNFLSVLKQPLSELVSQ